MTIVNIAINNIHKKAVTHIYNSIDKVTNQNKRRNVKITLALAVVVHHITTQACDSLDDLRNLAVSSVLCILLDAAALLAVALQ